jgi:hypothetical protein
MDKSQILLTITRLGACQIPVERDKPSRNAAILWDVAQFVSKLYLWQMMSVSISVLTETLYLQA